MRINTGINAFFPTPVSANSLIDDQIKGLVKWPRLVGFFCIDISEITMVIHIHLYFIRTPVRSVYMKFFGSILHNDGIGLLWSYYMVVLFGMYRSGIVGRHKSESLLIYVNGSDDDRTITLPRTPGAKDNYELLISTEGKNEPDRIITSERVSIGAMSMIVMRRKRPELPTDKPDSIKQQPLQVSSLPAVA